MPNFWSSATQKIYEVFYGPRTRDTEFDLKVKEMLEAERNVIHLKAIYFNFPKHTMGIRDMCKEVYTLLPMAYCQTSPYYLIISEIISTHLEVETLHAVLCENLTNICKQTAEWDNLFSEAKKNISDREAIRKIYDHYDEKMEKMVKIRNDKFSKNIKETNIEIEKFDRNELKYRKATDDYVKISMHTYNLIQELLDFKYKMINPTVSQFVTEERKFFTAVSDLFRKFDSLTTKLHNVERNVKKTNIEYNPLRYIRGSEVLATNPIDTKNVNVKFGKKVMEVPNEKIQTSSNVNDNHHPNFNSFTYEEYLKNRSQSSKEENQNIGHRNDLPYNFDVNKTKVEQDFQKIDNKFNNNDYNNRLNNQTYSFMPMPSNSNIGASQNSVNDMSLLNFRLNSLPNFIMPTDTLPEQVPDTFNPYSSLQFDNFVPTKSVQTSISRSQVPGVSPSAQPVGSSQYPNYTSQSQINYSNNDLGKKSYPNNNFPMPR